jgi:transposase
MSMGSLVEEVASLQVVSPCYILDNCSVHNDEDIAQECPMLGGEYDFAPSYSPMLNPVESCIADVKVAIQIEFATMLRATC